MFSLTPRLALRASTPTLLTRSLFTSPSLRSSQGYGSPDISNPPPAENNPSGASPSSSKSDQEKQAENKDMPKPNADASESAGDQSKPHYKCDTETSGAKGEQELKKPEDKK